MHPRINPTHAALRDWDLPVSVHELDEASVYKAEAEAAVWAEGAERRSDKGWGRVHAAPATRLLPPTAHQLF